MRELSSIRAALRAMLPELASKYGVSQLWIFGSTARGEAKEGSDLDLLVDFDRSGFSLIEFVGLELEIGDRLGLKVDLVDRVALRPEIAPNAMRDAVLV